MTVFAALQPNMVYKVMAVILNQTVSGRKSVLDTDGEIIFKALSIILAQPAMTVCADL